MSNTVNQETIINIMAALIMGVIISITIGNLSHIKDMAKVEETLELYWNYLKIEDDPQRVKELKEVLKHYGNQGGFVVDGKPLRELVRDWD